MTIFESVRSYFERMLAGSNSGSIVTMLAATAAVLLLSFITYYISRRIAGNILPKIAARTATKMDDLLVENNVFNRLTFLVPILVIEFFSPIILDGYPRTSDIVGKVLNLCFIVATVMVLEAFISALRDIYRTLKVARDIPLTGFFQVLKIILYFTGTIFMISVIFDRAPVYLLSGLGAMTAVLLLVFKDPILGFVAGVQLVSNRMLKEGDWIEMPKYGANGDVIDITLTTVKVRNFDRTITNIPTYALMTDSFKNWRGMQESGGRRIKRAINIDIGSIRFCTPEMTARYSKIRYIAEYMETKNQEICQYNKGLGDDVDPANARRLTNIGTFRAYIKAYLENHTWINTQMTFLVRQLAPTGHGLPLEIYVFCKDKEWARYEAVQSDVFDHLLAMAPEFDLRVFQFPTGHDLARVPLR